MLGFGAPDLEPRPEPGIVPLVAKRERANNAKSPGLVPGIVRLVANNTSGPATRNPPALCRGSFGWLLTTRAGQQREIPRLQADLERDIVNRQSSALWRLVHPLGTPSVNAN